MTFKGQFETLRIKTADPEIHLVHGGSGEPLLLLHGYPQTHVIGFVHRRYDVLAVWRERAAQVEGKGIGCGHFLPGKPLELCARNCCASLLKRNRV